MIETAIELIIIKWKRRKIIVNSLITKRKEGENWRRKRMRQRLIRNRRMRNPGRKRSTRFKRKSHYLKMLCNWRSKKYRRNGKRRRRRERRRR